MGNQAKDALFEAAFDVFAERGYAGASVREICARANANVAALNYHWGSKDALWLAVAERCGERFLAVLTEAVDLSAPPDEMLERVIHALFASLVPDPRPIRIVMWATMQAEAMDYEATARAFDPLVQASFAALRTMQERGAIDPDVDVDVVVPLIHGPVVYAFADRAGHRRFYGTDMSDPEHAARFERALIRMVRLVLGMPSAR